MDKIKFPKSINLHEFCEITETESKLVKQDGIFITTGKLIIDSFNLHGFNIIKAISISIKDPHNISKIDILINDSIVERMKPNENRTRFISSAFNINGIVQHPKLFDINLICYPHPPKNVDVTLEFHGVTVRYESFLKYNQYFSIHQVSLEDVDKLLAIYYNPSAVTTYNVRFIELKDVIEFNKVVEMPYDWECPRIIKILSDKKVKNKMITVEVDLKTEKIIDEDKELPKNPKKINTKSGVTISYITETKNTEDLESHLLSEYGLIPYVTILEKPATIIDKFEMSKITAEQRFILSKIDQSA
jgi:hypothetical protein